MNERIKQLAKQADDGYTGINGDDMGHALVGEDAIERFAELIVRECAEVAGCNAHVSGFSLGDLIKQHFGVKK